MSGEVTKDDLWDVRDQLTAQITEGFRGVHARQDKTNGRIGAAEIEAGKHQERIAALERDIREVKRASTPRVSDEGSRRITTRDVSIIIATLIAIGGLIQFLKSTGLLKAMLP